MLTGYDMALVMVPAVAVALDLFLGCPASLPHPVRYLGDVIGRVERWCFERGMVSKATGALAALAVVVLTAVCAWLLTAIPYLALATGLYLSYAGLALGCLLEESDRVVFSLEQGQLAEARTRLAGLVTRDTAGLDEQGVMRALAETMSENLNDAFVAPFFFLAVFGPVGLWVQKAVSTLDSMWGYRTERYQRFGWAAARADDVLAFLPARITGLAMIGAGALMGLGWRAAYSNLITDSAKTESPNAGWPMAAAAWLCAAPMGGPAVYFGSVKDKPVIGPVEGEWSLGSLRRLRSLVLYSGLLSAIVLFTYFALVAMSAG